MSGFLRTFAAPAGSTGNNTHASVKTSPSASKLCVAFVIESVGATPTVTAKIQGSMEPDVTVADGSANWFDLPFVTDTNDTVAASITKTGTGTYALFMSLPTTRFVYRVRVVTTSNTNVTYRAELHQQFNV